MIEEIEKDKVVLINGSLLNTILLIVIVVMVGCFLTGQMVFNFTGYINIKRSQDKLLDYFVVNRIAVAQEDMLITSINEKKPSLDGKGGR